MICALEGSMENENVTVQFSEEEMEIILKYQKAIEVKSVEEAIMHAVRVSLKRVYGLPAFDN